MPTLECPTLDPRTWRWVPVFLILLLSGCATYYGQLAQGQLDLLWSRESIPRILADAQRDPALRERLALALQARRFASESLALPDNGSYRDYVELGRPYVVWNVFATEELSLEPVTHCFPIAGCVAYRGYYQEARARGAAAELRLQGKDVYVAGVEAYSTLDWFDDPLLSSMLRWSDDRLAAVIFHELSHQRLYLPGDTAFNESYASFVEHEGLRQWRRSRGLPDTDDLRAAQRSAFTGLVLESRERLRALYASGQAVAALRAGKQAEFTRLRREYHALWAARFPGDHRYDGWFQAPLNNARLLPFGLYDRWTAAFAALYRDEGGNWRRFHRAVAGLAALPAKEREARLMALQAKGLGGAAAGRAGEARKTPQAPPALISAGTRRNAGDVH